MEARYDIELLRQKALRDLEIWLPQWYPKGRGRKGYFEVGDVFGTPGDSLKICLCNDGGRSGGGSGRRGLWYDFATAEGGDIFTLWGINRGVSGFGNILKDMAGYYGVNDNQRSCGKTEKRGSPDRRHIYLTADGDISCYIFRYEYNDGSKEFLPWNAATGKTEFPSPRPLYRLPQLMKTDKVILVEGEKCADALAAAGFTATTLMGGANTKVDKTDLLPLKGKDIILWPDNDEPGRKYADNVAEALLKLPVSSLKITPPTPDKPAKWDAADATAEKFDIAGHLAKAEIYAPQEKAEPNGRLRIADFTGAMFAAEPPELQFVVKDTIPRGVVGLLSAMGDTGKGMLLLDLALKICQDKTAMRLKAFGNPVTSTGSAVIFAGEDTADEIHRRIYKLMPGGLNGRIDPAKLHIIPLPNTGGPFAIARKCRGSDEFCLTEEFESIKTQLEAIPDLALVVFDPLASFAGLDLNADPRAASYITGQLAALATATNAAVIVAHHIRKNDGITSPQEARDAIRGTTAIVDGVRFAIAFWANTAEEKKIFSELNQEYRPNACFKGAVVKANFGADRTVRNYIRSETRAVLEEVPIKIVPKTLSAEEFDKLLIEAIGEAENAGTPFAISGISGLYENREKLPLELQDASRDFIRNTAKRLLASGQICRIGQTGNGDKKWLGIPDAGRCA